MPEEKEIRDFYEFVRIVLKKSIDVWTAGEGDIAVEVRDDSRGAPRAKIKGGATDRIGGPGKEGGKG